MSLRSASRIRAEISLLEKSLEAAHSLQGLEEWNTYQVPKNQERLARAQEELARAEGFFDWEFDGHGVFERGIAMRRLVDLADPLGQTLRWTARDLLSLEGVPLADADRTQLAEPVLEETFGGSFGLRLRAPQAFEQASFEGSVFERAASRVISIFQAAHADDRPEEEIRAAVVGLRRFAIEGLRKLTAQLSVSDKPTLIRWQGETVVTVTPDDANLLYATISEVTPSEVTTTVLGVLEGGDRTAGTFHIVVPGEPKPENYRGKIEEGGNVDLRDFRWGVNVRATLLVTEEDSPLLPSPKMTYVLRAMEPVQEERR